MSRPARSLAAWMSPAVAALGLGLFGCAEQPGDAIEPTPGEVISPEAPGDAGAAAPAETGELDVTEEDLLISPPAAEPSSVPAPEPDPAAEPETGNAASAEKIDLPAVTYDELLSRIAEGDAPVTLVDCWASWCAPCKENFPHVIDMAKAYEEQGLKVIALSFDAGTEVDDIDAAQVAEAQTFLAALDVSRIENLRHGQLLGESFEAFNITTIPAVFLYDADGKEVARFTYDDPNNQFSYDMVEAKVAELLGVEPKGVVEAAE